MSTSKPKPKEGDGIPEWLRQLRAIRPKLFIALVVSILVLFSEAYFGDAGYWVGNAAFAVILISVGVLVVGIIGELLWGITGTLKRWRS